MKTPIFALLLMAWLNPPVHAGQLIINETEAAIVVEYTGDPTDKCKTNALEDLTAFRDSSKADEDKKKSFENAKKLAEESRSRKWSGKTVAEKYD
jgi:hypothetical protein